MNLATASVLALYIFYFVLELSWGRLCGQIGVDYCDFWSAGRVANVQGYRAVYDLDLLKAVQNSILPMGADASRIAVIPFPFAPIFIPPFQLLALLPPLAGFVLWSVVNGAVWWLYLGSFSRSTAFQPASTRLRLLMFVSFPVFHNIFNGQVSVLLAICVGEFMRALLARRPFRAGLWLGGLALKPQLLIVLAPLLLLHRSWRTIAGLAAVSLAIVMGSLALVGMNGLIDVIDLWRLYASGQASNWIEGMQNFRMLGLQLAFVAPAWLAWTVAIAGMMAVLAICLYAWRRPLELRLASLGVALTGILAATISIAWHSHIHMAMVLIPPLLPLILTGRLPQKLLNTWVLLPSGAFLVAVFLPPALARMRIIPDPGASYIYSSFAAAQLAVDLWLFGWAVRSSRREL